jgi:hypothetical protein
MEEEIIRLKAELEQQKNRCAALEDQLDDLAVDNDRLRKLVSQGGSTSVSGFTSKNVTAHSSHGSAAGALGGGIGGGSGGGLIGAFNTSNTSTNNDWEELLVDGNDNICDRVQIKLENACGGMNVLCVAFCAYPGDYPLTHLGFDSKRLNCNSSYHYSYLLPLPQ